MGPEEWLERLCAALPGDVPAPTPAEREALLDLARVAAHTSERWTAPLSTFLVGVACAAHDPDTRVDAIRGLVRQLAHDDGRPQGDRPS
ncbi:DUF6457 domain-containing protein [Egicoccus sp. AB-alg2]|uniref:DUF6457 domain-containing protein n=1 Tax=Egicoccus sp. AB-alg2 TaxID=3242693 RepID=UPI00359D54CB